MPENEHLNQPAGAFSASGHPNIAGRERELRSLADEVRRLVALTVTHSASAEDTAQAARAVRALADALEVLVPAEPPSRFAFDPELAGHEPGPHDFFSYDVMLGLYNPLALPIEMTWEPPKAVGHARFTTPYEGPPGCVHGAVLAGAFDQVFNVANLSSGTAGPTRELSLRYRRPTPLHRPLVFEAWIEETTERNVTTVGHVMHEGEVTVESRGSFALIAHERIVKMLPDESPEDSS
jgi:acyl-coenzyme A thioesterase PaaI-like protein